ncbi:glycosyltransferase family 4 protein [Ornithinimicrobium kibberense]|uniref:D-inositol 3-phosphate glycosyltransferase n=2 Tax=Ornithinimicrobium kibberense TaxID=282060 RepID=A0ABV5UY39_9MICO|nr:glycosyltransferase family 4 protein [Ornithinimicrobium kibberense]
MRLRRPARVLLVTALVAGGVGRHVQMLAAGLAAGGHRVVVACPSEVAARFDLGQHAQIVPLTVGASAHPVRDARAVRVLRAVGATADVVHAHGLRAGALCSVALRRSDPLVVTTHNAPPDGRADRLVYTGMERLVAARSDLLLAVSPDLAVRARTAGAAAVDLAVVPAPAAARRNPAAARQQLRAAAGLEPDATVVLVVGRLAPQKGLARAVAMLDHLNRSGSAGPAGVHLVVAGEGPEEEQLGTAARGRADLHLLGHRTDVPDLLAGADVVLSAARWEGQPVWLQEALLQRAPVVATDVGGTALVVGGAAVLVPDQGGDDQVAAGLADAVRGLLEHPAERTILRGRAAVRAAELPTEADAVAAAVAAYERVLADHPRPGPAGA